MKQSNHGFSIMPVLLAILLIAGISLAVLTAWPKPTVTPLVNTGADTNPSNTPPSTTNTPPAPLSPTPSLKVANNSYDLTKIKVGDTVGTFTVNAINDRRGEVIFSGAVTVTGTYSYYDKDYAFTANQICFNELTAESGNKLPRETTDGRTKWFCLNNPKTISALGKPGDTGTATIIIDNYMDTQFQGEAWNKADLVKVISVSPL